MRTLWYCIPHTGEVGSYRVSGDLTDFPRGVFLAYSDCCLVTGFERKEEQRDEARIMRRKEHLYLWLKRK